MTNRIDKVNSLLEHEISKIISRDFNFPNILVTLTRVETTANLIEARAYISFLPDEKVSKILETLNKIVNMRPVPKIIFVADKTVSSASRIEEILNKLHNN